ncbi:indole-3-glycerol phosphate synthase TrpC [Salisediminibacterium beveridgei]|uniref:indole-3-glycerol phosphate synthase TrpC n=1 Tax=Salisediminibacterium beveridgei TaxID=632773 RepID=UPI0008480F36|nr:indole-3-glycerol phosphate synthase TrpC [Salisediminibacterium beveridgei]
MLDKIVKTKQEEIKHIILPEQRITNRPNVSFVKAVKGSMHPLGVIAEVKKASPSKGIIKEDFAPVNIARIYSQIGADAISVLTDENYFKGHKNYLTAIKESVDLPLLRKDFIIESVQVQESERIGADAILLIAAILEPRQLAELYHEARELDLDVLIEVHDESELEQVLQVVTPELIGVNNRDLRTFETDLAVTERLGKLVPQGTTLISESGIHNHKDVLRVIHSGAKGILAGESFMLAEDKQAFMNQLIYGEA